jgi:uncharacterized damage-inducible protein DinB
MHGRKTVEMSDCARVAERFHQALLHDPWHGDSVRKILNGITAEQAAAHPIAGAHSVWEIVHHMTAWIRITEAALGGAPMPQNIMNTERDWPPVENGSEEAWSGAEDDLYYATERLVEAMRAFPDKRLFETVPGREYTFCELLHGITEHSIYHSGQIVMLKKTSP